MFLIFDLCYNQFFYSFPVKKKWVCVFFVQYNVCDRNMFKSYICFKFRISRKTVIKN